MERTRIESVRRQAKQEKNQPSQTEDEADIPKSPFFRQGGDGGNRDRNLEHRDPAGEGLVLVEVRFRFGLLLLLGGIGGWFGYPDLSFQMILGWIFQPVMTTTF